MAVVGYRFWLPRRWAAFARGHIAVDSHVDPGDRLARFGFDADVSGFGGPSTRGFGFFLLRSFFGWSELDRDLFAGRSESRFFSKRAKITCQGIVPGHDKRAGAAVSVPGSTVERDTTFLTRFIRAVSAWVSRSDLWEA